MAFKIDTNIIHAARMNCLKCNYGRNPDFVMIHLIHREHFLEELLSSTNIYIPNIHDLKIFGMQIIWTMEIRESDCICTYKNIK